MREEIYQSEYAGHAVRCRFLTPVTRYHFGPWVHRADGEEYDVFITPERLSYARTLMPEEAHDSYVEFRALSELTSHPLLKHGCCFFHAVSFAWQDRAFLLTAPSGIGKTTQFLNWQRLYPGEITMICGDMPVLERREDGSIWVHPSPWNGKENLGDKNHPPAPLGGIVLLEQGQENTVAPLPARDAVLPLFSQFIVQPDTEEEILALTGLMDQMLRNVPVWKLTNRGDDASTELLRQTLKGGGHDKL